MEALLEPLRELAEIEEIQNEKKKEAGLIQITGCVGSQKTHLTCALGSDCKYKLIVTSGESKAKQMYEEYRFLKETVYLYPAKDLLFYHADLRGKQLVSSRMETIQALLLGEGCTVITTFDAFMDSLLPIETIRERVFSLKVGDIIDFEKVQKDLMLLGYEREVQIEGPGQFAVRGGILDVYPLTEEVPVRIELWDDEIDSIRTFDVESQRSIENLEEITIYPASEFMDEKTKRVSFLDYFPREDTLLFLEEPARLIEQGEAVEAEFIESMKKRVETGCEVSDEEVKLFAPKEIASKMNQYPGIGLSILEGKRNLFHVKKSIHLQVKGVNPYNNSFETLTRDLARLKRSGYRVILLSGSRTRAKRLAEDLRDYSLSSFYSEEMDREVQPGEIMVAYGHVDEGYEYPLLKFLGRKRRKRNGKLMKDRKSRASRI